jgi:hypothetical protein
MTRDAHDGGDSPRKTTKGPKSGLKIKTALNLNNLAPQVHAESGLHQLLVEPRRPFHPAAKTRGLNPRPIRHHLGEALRREHLVASLSKLAAQQAVAGVSHVLQDLDPDQQRLLIFFTIVILFGMVLQVDGCGPCRVAWPGSPDAGTG